ncbi:MAG: hypothetical protein U0361_21000 [Nitrospiraceae bacterium]
MNDTLPPLSMSRLDRFIIMAVVLLVSVFPVELFPNTPPPPQGVDGQYSGKQGQVLLVKVPGLKDAAKVQGRFLGRTVSFFQDPAGGESGG